MATAKKFQVLRAKIMSSKDGNNQELIMKIQSGSSSVDLIKQGKL